MTITTVQTRVARQRDTWSLAWAHAVAVFRHRPRFLRWMAPIFTVGIVPTMAGWVERRELYAAGVGTTVCMTPTSGRRRAGSRDTIGVIVLVLFFAAVAAELFIFDSSVIAEAGVVCCVAIMISMAAAKGFGRRRSDQRAAIAQFRREATVVVLHDLCRPDPDPRNLGTDLLATVIRDRDFEGSVIVATAAVEKLAARYVEAGMTRFAPDSLTVYYRA